MKKWRTIVIAHVNLNAGRVMFLAKKQRIQPADKDTIDFLPMTPHEEKQLGVKPIKYCLNHYEDDRVYIWPTYSAHIASTNQSEDTLKQILLNELSCKVSTEITNVIDAKNTCLLRCALIENNRKFFEHNENQDNFEISDIRQSKYESLYLLLHPHKKRMKMYRVEQPWTILNRSVYIHRFGANSGAVKSFRTNNRDSPEIYFSSYISSNATTFISRFFDQVLYENSGIMFMHDEQLKWLKQVYEAIRTSCN